MEKRTPRQEYKINYNKNHYKRITIDIPHWEYNIWKEYSESNDVPITTLIRSSVRKCLDNYGNQSDL